MTVQELIDLLQETDPSREVILLKDGGRFGCTPVSQITTGSYLAYDEFKGEGGPEALTPQNIEDGFTEEDLLTEGVPAIFIEPTE